MKKKLTDEQLVHYYRRGWTMAALAKVVGVSTQRIQQRLKRCGVKGTWNTTYVPPSEWRSPDVINRDWGSLSNRPRRQGF